MSTRWLFIPERSYRVILSCLKDTFRHDSSRLFPSDLQTFEICLWIPKWITMESIMHALRVRWFNTVSAVLASQIRAIFNSFSFRIKPTFQENWSNIISIDPNWQIAYFASPKKLNRLCFLFVLYSLLVQKKKSEIVCPLPRQVHE